jgi:hypothetical protein
VTDFRKTHSIRVFIVAGASVISTIIMFFCFNGHKNILNKCNKHVYMMPNRFMNYRYKNVHEMAIFVIVFKMKILRRRNYRL